MATQFPNALDNFTNPLATDKLNNPSHSAQHANANDAVEAIQGYVGIASSTSGNTLTGRIVALEAGGGSGGGDATSVDGWSVEVVASLPAIQDPNTIYFVEGPSTGNYLPLTGGTMTGPINWNMLGQTGLINIVSDPNSSTGEVLNVESNAGVQVTGPYVVLDTTNLQITMPGATPNAAITVAAIDSFGVVSLGYTTLPPPSYSATATTATPVVIKAANVAPPTAWISTGLSITLGQDVPLGTGTIAFEGIFSNPTTRSGTVEFGLQVNAGAVNGRDIVTQIAPNFLQTIAMQYPMMVAYVDGDVLEIMARVTANDNNQFSLTMVNSATDLGAMRIQSVGGGSGATGAVNSVGGVAPIASSGGTDPQISMPAASGSQSGYLSSTYWNTFNNKVDPATSLAGYGITNAYTKTETDSALALKAPLASPAFTGNPTAPTATIGDNDTTIATTAFTVAEIGNRAPTKTGTGASGTWPVSITGTAALATAVNDNGAGASLKFWYGTTAQYEAISTKDNATLYFQSS